MIAPVALALLLADPAIAARPPHRTEVVVLVTTDGLRRQEVFAGANEALLGAGSPDAGAARRLRQAFWRPTPEARRAALLPFLWGTVAARGQLFRNVRVSNRHRLSYPGYAELLTGVVDPRVVNNDAGPNPRQTVLGWLEARPGFAGRVAAFASWDVLGQVINDRRVTVNAGGAPTGDARLDRLIADVATPWDALRFDAFTFEAATNHLRRRAPRVLYVGLGETDDWAHEGRYDRYLQAARRADGFLARLWEALQADPATRGRTSLIVTTDHGRGDPAWRVHGAEVAGSDEIWAAVLGPDTPPRGVRGEPATQAQTAATVAALLGADYAGATGAAPPLDVLDVTAADTARRR